MATNPENVPRRRLADRTSRDWKPRLSAVEIVDEGGAWSLRLTDRATCLELALLRLAYGVELAGEDSRGMILKPRAGLPCPTRENLVEALTVIHERRGANRGR